MSLATALTSASVVSSPQILNNGLTSLGRSSAPRPTGSGKESGKGYLSSSPFEKTLWLLCLIFDCVIIKILFERLSLHI